PRARSGRPRAGTPRRFSRSREPFMSHVGPLMALHRRYIVEETASALRHDLRNKFASIANARFFLRRRFETGASAPWHEDARVAKFFDLIGREVLAAAAPLTPKLPAPLAEAAPETSCDAMAVCRRQLARSDCPSELQLTGSTSAEPVTVAVDALDLE